MSQGAVRPGTAIFSAQTPAGITPRPQTDVAIATSPEYLDNPMKYVLYDCKMYMRVHFSWQERGQMKALLHTVLRLRKQLPLPGTGRKRRRRGRGSRSSPQTAPPESGRLPSARPFRNPSAARADGPRLTAAHCGSEHGFLTDGPAPRDRSSGRGPRTTG